MDVLIKGMEMPKGCITCMFKSESLFNRTMWCEWLDDPLGDYTKCDEEWRHPDCPLVEVSTPHGRLIDADDAFIDADERGFDFWSCDADIDSAHEFLMAQPTFIEAEEGAEA